MNWPHLFSETSCDIIRINRFHTVCCSSFNLDDLKLMIGDVEAVKLFKMARRFMALRLRPEEVAVMSAMLLFNSGE